MEKRTWYYWLIYLFLVILTVVFVALRIRVLSYIYVLCWPAILVIGAIEQKRLGQYLQKHHSNVFARLASRPFARSGYINSFQTLSFVFSGDNYQDDGLKRLKSTNRQVLLLGTVIFFSFVIYGCFIS